MHLSFDRRTALMLLRHVGGKPTIGKRADRDVKVSAAGGRLFVGNSYATAACDAVVLEPGAFWIQRTFLEKVLRSFHGKEIIVLEADSKRLTLGRFSCGILNDEPAPEPPAAFEFVATPGAVRLSGEGFQMLPGLRGTVDLTAYSTDFGGVPKIYTIRSSASLLNCSVR